MRLGWKLGLARLPHGRHGPRGADGGGRSGHLLSTYIGDGPPARLDAVLVQPEVEWLVLGGSDGGQALLRSFARSPRTQAVTLEGTGPTTARSYDQLGVLVAVVTSRSGTVAAPVAADGFTLVTR